MCVCICVCVYVYVSMCVCEITPVNTEKPGPLFLLGGHGGGSSPRSSGTASPPSGPSRALHPPLPSSSNTQ